MVLIFLAGLRALPREPFEAAAIDGASRVQIFWRITLPMLSKVMAVAILVRGIDLFRFSFAYIYTMTSGGPGTVTETIIYYAWKQTFTFIKWGYGATLSLLTLIALILICNLFIYFARVRW
jgi:multiple sugar transport system permease protein